MAIFTDQRDIEILQEAGRRLAFVLDKVVKKVAPGVIEKELDGYAYILITERGDIPAFKNYRPIGASRPYPATICIQKNNKVVHGIPTGERLNNGDIVVIDVGLAHKGFFVDMAVTVPVGTVDEEAQKLITVTRDALYTGIDFARAGNRVGDISAAIEQCVGQSDFSIVREFGGHGVGRKPHEDPFIPNWGKKNTGPILTKGLVVAIEPIVNEGSPRVILDKDGYTVRTHDEKRSAQFEHTILITDDEPVIITKNTP